MKSRAQLGTGTHDALRPACLTSSDKHKQEYRNVRKTLSSDFCVDSPVERSTNSEISKLQQQLYVHQSKAKSIMDEIMCKLDEKPCDQVYLKALVRLFEFYCLNVLNKYDLLLLSFFEKYLMLDFLFVVNICKKKHFEYLDVFLLIFVENIYVL